jgi:hypothetical protein
MGLRDGILCCLLFMAVLFPLGHCKFLHQWRLHFDDDPEMQGAASPMALATARCVSMVWWSYDVSIFWGRR